MTVYIKIEGACMIVVVGLSVCFVGRRGGGGGKGGGGRGGGGGEGEGGGDLTKQLPKQKVNHRTFSSHLKTKKPLLEM